MNSPLVSSLDLVQVSLQHTSDIRVELVVEVLEQGDNGELMGSNSCTSLNKDGESRFSGGVVGFRENMEDLREECRLEQVLSLNTETGNLGRLVMDPMPMMSMKETGLSPRRIGLGVFLTVPEINREMSSTAAGWIPYSKQQMSHSPSVLGVSTLESLGTADTSVIRDTLTCCTFVLEQRVSLVLLSNMGSLGEEYLLL